MEMLTGMIPIFLTQVVVEPEWLAPCRLIESTPLTDAKVTEDPESMDTTEADVPLVMDSVSEEDIDNITQCLGDASKVLKNADNLIVSNYKVYCHMAYWTNRVIGWKFIIKPACGFSSHRMGVNAWFQ